MQDKLRNVRLPLQGHIDLTYRCNNHCRHCWLWVPANAREEKNELGFDEIKNIVDDARSMGCHKWGISGGEPMLRDDFAEIFDYITSKAVSYSINTNGTLITPEIAKLLKRKGTKMVALYGATKETYDHVTRHPGGFEKVMRGLSYLKEAGAGFIVQLIPMRDNWHEWGKMVELAKSLSKKWRVGAPWFYLSSSANPQQNKVIAEQRLMPRDVIELDKPNLSYGERMAELGAYGSQESGREESSATCGNIIGGDDRLFARCIAGRRDFHIDPYGNMTWCSFIKDPSLRYDLRSGSFREAWDTFIPSCADRIRGGEEWLRNCGTCEKRDDCRWCPVYAYLETGRYSAPVPYLCAVAEEARKFKANWLENHRRYFKIGGITVRVESDLDLDVIKFKEKLTAFAVDGPGADNVTIRHYFELPDLNGKDLGEEIYRKPPWTISRKRGTWFYGISQSLDNSELLRVAVFNPDHTRATIYSLPRDGERICHDGWHSLSLLPTDQIWLGQLLADRNAVLLHSAAAIINGGGFLFVGHSEAGKSTTMTLLKDTKERTGLECEILCDDRNIVRNWNGENDEGLRGWHVHGTWSHGDVADVSPACAPLRAILFLEKDTVNQITPITDRRQIRDRLLATLIRPVVTAEWWEKELNALERLVRDVPCCYWMRFDGSSDIVPQIERLGITPPYEKGVFCGPD